MGKQSRIRAQRLSEREPVRAARIQALYIAGQQDQKTIRHLRALSAERQQAVLNHALNQLNLRRSPHRTRAAVVLGAMLAIIREDAGGSASAMPQDVPRVMLPPYATGELDRLPQTGAFA